MRSGCSPTADGLSLLNCMLLHCCGAIQHATDVSSAVEGLIHAMMLQNAEPSSSALCIEGGNIPWMSETLYAGQ